MVTFLQVIGMLALYKLPLKIIIELHGRRKWVRQHLMIYGNRHRLHTSTICARHCLIQCKVIHWTRARLSKIIVFDSVCSFYILLYCLVLVAAAADACTLFMLLLDNPQVQLLFDS